MCSHKENDVESSRERNRADKISGGRARRIFFAVPAQRINAPRHAGSQHQDRTDQRRSGESGKYKRNESGHRDDEADDLDGIQPFARVQAPQNHCGLNRAK